MVSNDSQMVFKSLSNWFQIAFNLLSNRFQIGFKFFQIGSKLLSNCFECRFNIVSMSLQWSFETFVGWGHARIICRIAYLPSIWLTLRGTVVTNKDNTDIELKASELYSLDSYVWKLIIYYGPTRDLLKLSEDLFGHIRT